MAYSLDLRERVIKSYQNNQWTYKQISNIYHIGQATVTRWLRRYREEGNLQTKYNHNGRKRKYTESDVALIKTWYAKEADLTLEEGTRRYNKKSITSISVQTFGRIVRENLGLTRKKNFSRSTTGHPTSTRNKKQIP